MESDKLRDDLFKQERSKPELALMRHETCMFVADSFRQFGEVLQVSGHLIGDDRKNGLSPFQFGSDETYGMSLILRIGSELAANSVTLFQDKQTYAAAALLRQMVEVEYLAWAFDTRHADAETWLRSNKTQRMDVFSPRNLRKAAQGKFRAKDYGYHCDLGGHPTPAAINLLSNDPLVIQILVTDLIGHMSGIWNHFVGWGKQRTELQSLFKELQPLGIATGTKLEDWSKRDPLTGLGPPP